MEKDKNKLDNIKSFYILKEIFNYLSKSVFLDFINFNKTLQGKFEINIEDYKKFGNRTKIIENNGLGKEYKLNTDILIFEGEYLNGKKNGKGKEYYENDQIKFEGEYLNGKIIEGKGYDDKANEFLIIEKMEMEQNILKMVAYNLKENIIMAKDGMEQDIIMKEKKNTK